MKIFNIVLIIFLVTINFQIKGQDLEDVVRFSQSQSLGTARSVAMGNAFSSLGGDFSSISYNPAGIAIYRSSEFSFTPSINFNSTKSTFNEVNSTENKTSLLINQFGFVGTYRPMREVNNGIVSTHFAIGYNRNNNFNFKSFASAINLSNSLTDILMNEANDMDPGASNRDNLSKLGKIAYYSYIIDALDNGKYTNYLAPNDSVDQTKLIEENGYSGEFFVSTGINISNKLLLGASLSLTSMHYKETSNYYEYFSPDNPSYDNNVFESYNLHNYFDASGVGFNLKIGAIYKPIEGFNVGLAIHTPTWYSIYEDYGANIDATFFDTHYAMDNSGKTYYDNKYDYHFHTPFKIIGGLSYILGKKAIFSFDYEYIDYSSAKLKSMNNNIQEVLDLENRNKVIEKELKQTNNYRFGIEYRINPNISLRGGYSFNESPYTTEPKDNQTSRYSAGMGYRNKSYFIDFAYALSSYDKTYINDTYGPLNPIKINVNNHYAVITMGWKF